MRINIVNKTNRDFFIKSSHQNKINFNSFCVASEPFNSKNLDDFYVVLLSQSFERILL